MHGKIMEFEKKTEKSWQNLFKWNNLMKPPVAKKLAVGRPTASFLATGGYTYVFDS